jgi:hypothetical protein
LPVRAGCVWVEPDEVWELGVVGRIGPLVPPPADWPVFAVGVPSPFCVPDDVPCVPEIDASGVAVAAPPGVVAVPPGVVDWPVVAVPVADGVPVPALPEVWSCWVDTAPPDGGSSRDGGKTSVLERFGVTGPLGLGVRAGAPLPALLPGVPVVPDVEVPADVDEPDED